MRRASLGVLSAAAKAATTTRKIARPRKATVSSAVWASPVNVSSTSARVGKASMESWFQMPVSATASPTAALTKPQARSIANESAIPTATPPGATYVEAVEAWVTTNAWRKRRPGSAAIHGGANVTRLRIVAPARSAMSFHDSPLTTPQTSR